VESNLNFEVREVNWVRSVLSCELEHI